MGDDMIEVHAQDGLRDEDRERLDQKEAASEEVDAAVQQNQLDRVKASTIIAAMPDFWKERFKQVALRHGSTRRGRRATKALLREYGSWLARTAHLRALQAQGRSERAEDRKERNERRVALGKRPLRGPKAVVIVVDEAAAMAAEAPA